MNEPRSNDVACLVHMLFRAYILYNFASVLDADGSHGIGTQIAALQPFPSTMIVDPFEHFSLNSNKIPKLPLILLELSHIITLQIHHLKIPSRKKYKKKSDSSKNNEKRIENKMEIMFEKNIF